MNKDKKDKVVLRKVTEEERQRMLRLYDTIKTMHMYKLETKGKRDKNE